MFNPFDGLLMATGSGVFAAFLLALGSSPVLAAVITGMFMLAGKLIEIYVKGRRDKRAQRDAQRIAQLERQLSDRQPADL
jgi:hypothetical protein